MARRRCEGYRHLDEVVAWNRELMDATAAELALGTHADHARRRPLPGHRFDHRRRRCIAATRGKQLRVLWLDAHADFNTSEVTPSGNIHGMPVACLCGIGPDAADPLGRRMCPAMAPGDIRQIGIRSVDEGEKRLIKENGLDVYDMRYIDEVGMKRDHGGGAGRAWTTTPTCT